MSCTTEMTVIGPSSS